MKIAGVDLGGRKAAISVFEAGKLIEVAHLEVPPTTRSQELRTLGHWGWTYLKVCDFVFIEEPLVGKNVRSSLQIAQTAGAVMAMAASVSLQHTYMVPVTTWKKAVVGSGNANKDAVRNWLYTTYPSYAEQTDSNQDRVDAICIGLYGVLVHDKSGKLEEL